MSAAPAGAGAAALEDLIALELAQPVPPVVAGFAAHLAEQLPGTCAVLFYGSSLRSGDLTGTLLDYYLIVDSYALAYGGGWRAWANRLLPPNVFYAEWTDPAGLRYRAKYAVLTLADLHARCLPGSWDVSIWARFAQPTALVWDDGGGQHRTMAAILAQAATTALRSVPPEPDAVAQWSAVFARTYGCEWRAERAGKGGDLVGSQPERYRAIASCIDQSQPAPPQPSWALRRLFGRTQHLARLIKAAFTFTGGIDYLAWKIERHSGVPVLVKPWHRRWPVLGGLVLFAGLKRRRAFR